MMPEGAPDPDQVPVAVDDASEGLTALDGCGCAQCIAVQVDQTEARVARHETPDAPHGTPGAELNNALEPFVPPPIARAIA